MVHGVSQGRRELPEGDWYMDTTEARRVYAACTSSVVPAVWMSQFLRTSLWTNADHKVLVYMRAAEDEPEFSRWLHDISRLHKVDWVDIRVTASSAAALSSKIYMFASPRDALVYWELDSFQGLIGQEYKDTAKWFRDSFRKRWWPWLQGQGIPEEHFIPGQCGNKNSLVNEFAVHKNSISTFALLLLVRKWSCSMTSSETRQRAIGLFQAIVCMAPKQFAFSVRRQVHGEVCNVVEFVDVQVAGGKILRSPELQSTVGSPDPKVWSGWPYKDIFVHDAATYQGMASDNICFRAMKGLSIVVEQHVLAKHQQESAVIAKIVHQQGHLIDPDIKEMMHKIGRNSYRTSHFCKALRLRIAGNAFRMQLAERTKYWLALRESMAGCSTVATSVDATRLSGRDWQCGPICNVTGQQYAWMSPVVPFASMLFSAH